MGKFWDLVGLFFFGFVALFAGVFNLILEYPLHSIFIVLIVLAIKYILKTRKELMKNYLFIAFIIGGLLACLLSLNGCSPLGQLTAAQLTGLTTEQIDALDKAGQSVMVCLQGGGPPGAGALSVVGVPKSATGNVSFAPDCHPTVNVQVGGATKPAVTPAPAVTATKP